jgi:4-amino-4-deoxy-L-arabinose transferase-like glycosyltransferase
MTINIFKKQDIWISFLLFFVCTTLRLLFIDNRDIALDEPFTLYYAQQDVGHIIDMLYNENNPPLHFILLHYWIKWFGMSAFSVRLPSVLFSSLTAVTIYLTGSKFLNRTTGIAAALILSFSTMHIFFAHEARVYPLFCFLTAGSLYFSLSALSFPGKKMTFIWLFLFNVLLIYSHYFGFYILFIEAISVCLFAFRKEIIKPFILLFIGLGIAYIPMIVIFLHRFGTSAANGTWVAPPGITEVYGNINRFINTRINTAVLILIFACLFFVIYRKGILTDSLRKLKGNQVFKIIFSWFFVPYLFMFLISFKVPMFIDRYILYTSVPLYLTVAYLIVHFQPSVRFGIIAVSAFLASMIFTIQLNPDNNRRLKEVAAAVKDQKKTNTIVFLAPDYAYMGFAYHYDVEKFKAAPGTVELLNNDNIYPVSDTASVNKILNASDKSDCIYIQAGTEFTDPGNLILHNLESKFKKSSVLHVFEIYNIYHFNN